MNTSHHDPVLDEQIRSLLEHWSQAVRDKNLDAIMHLYHPDVVAYDAVIQLQFEGIDAYRAHWAFCLGLCPGPMLFEQREVVIHGAGDVAFAHWLNHCGSPDENGQMQSAWMRGSAGYLHTADGWKIVHEHFSAPFDMASGKALFDLQPGTGVSQRREAMSVKAVPDDFHTVTVYLGVHDGHAAIDFYKRIFKAREEFRLDRPDGRVGHAELYIGDTRIMLSEPCDQGALSSPVLTENADSPHKSPVGLHLYVEDVDATFELATDEEGVVVVSSIKDQFYGDRSGSLLDPFGHLWFISTHKEDVSPDEIKARARALFQGPA